MKQFDVITIGAATQDVFLISRDFKIIESTEFSTGYGECFSFGSKVELKDIHFDTGGGATNAAVTFANFGMNVAAHTRIGGDAQGKTILADLKQRKVDGSLVITDTKEKSGYSTILLTAEGDRTILVFRGACKDFKPAEFKSTNKTRWIYLTSVAGSAPMLAKVFEYAKKNNVLVAWNPGSAELGLDKELLKKYLVQSKVVIMNKEEAERFLGTTGTVAELVKGLKFHNPLAYMVVTDGANGATVSYDSHFMHVASLGSTAVNTTGAGDAFGSAFTAGVMLKNDIRYALQLAALNADGVIQQMGAKQGILDKLPTKRFLDRVVITNL